MSISGVQPTQAQLSLLDDRAKAESLADALTELAAFCKHVQLTGTDDKVVCDFSSNNLTFERAVYNSKWLHDRSIKLYALDLPLNRIVHAHWTPVVQLEDIAVVLCGVAQSWWQLPASFGASEQCISLALPVYTQGISAWVEGWNRLSELFKQQAYGLTDVDKFAPVPNI